MPESDGIVTVVGIDLGLSPACWLVLDDLSIDDVLGDGSNPSVVQLKSICDTLGSCGSTGVGHYLVGQTLLVDTVLES